MVYSLRRIRVRKDIGYAGDNKLRFDHNVPMVEGFSLRLEPQFLNPLVRVTEKEVEVSTETFAEEGRRWQTECN